MQRFVVFVILIVFYFVPRWSNIAIVENTARCQSDYYKKILPIPCRQYLNPNLRIDDASLRDVLRDYLQWVHRKWVDATTEPSAAKSNPGPTSDRFQAFIISLDQPRYRERLLHTQGVLQSLGLPRATHLPAYDTKEWQLAKQYPALVNFLSFESFEGPAYKEKVIGCFLSHLLVYYHIATSGAHPDAYTLVLEDDLEVNPHFLAASYATGLNFRPLLDRVHHALDLNKSVVYLGKCYENCYKLRPIGGWDPALVHAFRPQCLHAYLIRNSFAKHMLDYILHASLEEIHPIDSMVVHRATAPVNIEGADENSEDRLLTFQPSILDQSMRFESVLRTRTAQANAILGGDCPFYLPPKKLLSVIGAGVVFFLVLVGLYWPWIKIILFALRAPFLPTGSVTHSKLANLK